MCGLSGMFSAGNSRPAVESMTTCLAHRGPDDTGIEWLNFRSGAEAGTFGHRRLAILDLSAGGHQPRFSTSGRLCITYNGEIYNYSELKSELAANGVTFETASDTEVLLRGWEIQGARFLNRLRGMYAIAIWDRDAETGYLIRDPFGIKPLYVAEVDGDVIFASEIRSILDTDLVPRRLSRLALESYLSAGSVAEPLTIIEGIHAVPPGSVTRVTAKGGSFALAGSEPFATPFVVDEDAKRRHPRSHIHRIRDALRESVKYHLVSDVPVGVFLSGGMDSSAVAGLASEVSSTPIESFTVTFEEADYSEAEPAREAARRFGTRHHEVLLSSRDLLDMLPALFSAMDQPSMDGLNTFVVSRAVADFGLKVVLSGLGGDELFGGYPSFRRAHMIAPLWKLPRAIRRAGAVSLGPFSDVRAARVSALLRDDMPALAAYRASRTLFGDKQVDRLMGLRTVRPATAASSQSFELRGLNTMQQVSMYEMTGYMRNTLLRDSDVFSMACGLELRVPLVDIKVAQVAYEAAASIDRFDGSTKPMLLEAVRDLVPESSFSKPKKGFTLPFEKWMRQEMFSEVDSILSSSASSDLGLDSGEIASVWSSFQGGRPGITWSRPWALYTLLRWAAENRISYEPEAVSGIVAEPELAGMR
jgi:asparagine synthase (glutamine-hydrolysing)